MISKGIQKLIMRHSGENSVHEESILLSQINTNFISVIDRGHQDPVCRERLCEYFGRKGLWKSIDDLFNDAYPNTKAESSLLSWSAKVDLLEGRNIPHTGPFQGGLTGGYGESQLHFNTPQGLCLDLQEFFLLERNAQIDRDFFGYFFAYRLSKREFSEVNNFLIVNFTTQFGSEINPFMDFVRHELIPTYKRLIGPRRVSILRAFLKKIQGKAPYVRVKEVRIKERSLEELFGDGFENKKNAELFRSVVIHRILEKDGKQIPGAKRKLNMVVNFLFYQRKVWHQDLELKTIADTLRKECHFKTLNPKGFQRDQIKEVDHAIEKALDRISWIKST